METKQLYENNEPFYPATQADIIVAGGGVNTTARHIVRHKSDGYYIDNIKTDFSIEQLLDYILSNLPLLVTSSNNIIDILKSPPIAVYNDDNVRITEDYATATAALHESIAVHSYYSLRISANKIEINVCADDSGGNNNTAFSDSLVHSYIL